MWMTGLHDVYCMLLCQMLLLFVLNGYRTYSSFIDDFSDDCCISYFYLALTDKNFPLSNSHLECPLQAPYYT